MHYPLMRCPVCGAATQSDYITYHPTHETVRRFPCGYELTFRADGPAPLETELCSYDPLVRRLRRERLLASFRTRVRRAVDADALDLETAQRIIDAAR